MPERMERIQKLLILHTNDLHSFFEQMPKISTVIQRLRAGRSPDEVLTIDIGDHMDRMRMETEGTDGVANIEIMNQTGYEVATLGNNEGLTFKPELLAKVYREHAQFRLVGSNLYDLVHGTIPSWLQPYTIIHKGNIRVGVIGVTVRYADFYELLGWDVRDPFQVVSERVREIRHQVDLVIILSHLGLEHDKQMARDIPGIDCIFGGHTHHLLEQPLYINGTYICAAGKFGQHVGKMELHFDMMTKTIVHAEGACIDVNDYPNDPRIERLIERFHEQSIRQLNEVCAVIEEPLPINWYDESPLGNLLASGIRKWTDAEIGIVNAGQIMDGLAEGEVTRKRLLEICPPPINPCRMLLSGEMILKALEQSLLVEFQEMPIRGFGFRGKVLGHLCVDGMEVEYDPDARIYEKVKRVWVNGLPLEPEKEYVVGTIDMFTFGVGYTSIAEGREVQFFLPELIRDVLQQQLADPEMLRDCKRLRWLER